MIRNPGASPAALAVATLLVFSACTLGCSSGAAKSVSTEGAPEPLVLLTGPTGGAYSPLGHALADVYNTKVPGVRVSAESTNGPEGAAGNPQALESGKVDLAFSRADLAYQTFRGSPSSHLRSIAVVYTNAVHLLVRRGSGITRGEDMAGHRVQIADEAGGGILSRIVVEGHGVALDQVKQVGNARNGITRLKMDELDVRIFASAYPLAAIDDVGPSSQIALLSLSPTVVERLRSRFPFFKPAVIPKGTYKGQDQDVSTVGIDGLLLCRDTMSEAIVYELTKTLFDALPDLAKVESSAKMINVVNAPATPVPLHPGAARYYRERDLFR